MGGNGDRSDARPSPTVRDAKCLVQIQMADVCPEFRRGTNPDLSVEVRPVHVDLPAMIVNDPANGANPFLEDSVGGGIRHHDGRQSIGVGHGLGFQVGEVDIFLLFIFVRQYIN
jgi:hypothetical protein